MKRRYEILKEIKKMKDLVNRGGVFVMEIHSRVIELSFKYSTAEIAARYLRKKGYKVSMKDKITYSQVLPYLEGIRTTYISIE